MPSRWTFSIPPISDFIRKWQATLAQDSVIVDPMCGNGGKWSTHHNDLVYGKDAEEFCWELHAIGTRADMVLFDPPYSPRQISECYKSVGLPIDRKTTQNSVLYARVRFVLDLLLKHEGIALSFGWQSSGFGKQYKTVEIMLCQHGGAHNDTICVAQIKQ